MSNSTSLLLYHWKSCRDYYPWEPLAAFLHSLLPSTYPHHLIRYHRLITTDSIPTLHAHLILPAVSLLLLSFTILLLPRLLWSLATRSTLNHCRHMYVEADNETVVHGEAETEDACCSIGVNDLYWSGKGDLVADIVAEGGDLLFSLVERDMGEGDPLLAGQAKAASSNSSPGEDAAGSCEASGFSLPPAEEDDLMVDGFTSILHHEMPPTAAASDEFHSPHPSFTGNADGCSIDDDKDQLNHLVDVPIRDDGDEFEMGLIVVDGDGDQQTTATMAEEAEQEQEREEQLTETCTNGSTSKSSFSANFRDSETDGFFSSSSRRSSSRWESYTVYRKYDEEMMFFDRISSQKLKETESLRSIKVQPRSFSERIVHKLSTSNGRRGCNPYQELEAAYVAQVCLAWEAISWNYNSFRRVTAVERQRDDRGCPAQVAQQFQQFLVLLQRFIENEPYEYGRRPEVYARIRISSPKLLQVPEFHGGDLKEEFPSRISSSEFLKIMEDIIRTFMTFLKADKARHWQNFKTLILRSRSTSVDPNMFDFIRKANRKKKSKLKNLQGGGNCMRKVKLKAEEETEILMCLVDMKIVSRVLRMPEMNEQQLHWCEEKMRKVRFCNGRAQRDSTPLFFPGQ